MKDVEESPALPHLLIFIHNRRMQNSQHQSINSLSTAKLSQEHTVEADAFMNKKPPEAQAEARCHREPGNQKAAPSSLQTAKEDK